jgi:hypothetical protein
MQSKNDAMSTAAQLIAEGEIPDWQKKMLDLR